MKIALRKREAQGISAVPVIRFFVLEYTPGMSRSYPIGSPGTEKHKDKKGKLIPPLFQELLKGQGKALGSQILINTGGNMR